MSYQIKNGSSNYPLVFLLVDSTDHITGKLGATPTVTIRKAGGSFGAPAGAVTEIGNGWYQVAGHATDTNTSGPLLLHASATGADPVDMLFAVLDQMPSDIYARLGTPALASVSADIAAAKTDTAAIKLKTDNLPTDPADASDIAASFVSLIAKVDAVDDLLDTEMPALTATAATILADTNDIQTRLPATLVGGRMPSNLEAIDNSTTALAAFKRGVKSNVIGTVGGGSTATSIVSSSLTPAGSVTDQFKGRMMIFADDTTSAVLRGQATEITGSTAAANPVFSVVALTTAPVTSDAFVIV